MRTLEEWVCPVPKPTGGDGRWPSGHLWSGRSPSCPRYDLPPPGVRPSRAHTGVDIGGVSGSYLVAPDDGWLEWVGFDVWGGNYKVLRHRIRVGRSGSRLVWSRHAHCLKDNLGLKLGTLLEQGQPFALLGSTGSSASPHDHTAITLTATLPSWRNRQLFLDPEPVYYPGRYEYMQQGHPFPNEVKVVQKALNDRGYTPKLKVDGDYGPATAAAVRWFQGQIGTEQHGALNELGMAMLLPGKAA